MEPRVSSNINVVMTTITTPSTAGGATPSTLQEDDTSDSDSVRRRMSPVKMVGVTGLERQNHCCGHWFPSTKSFHRHLAEKALTDSGHEKKLKQIGMVKCTHCSVWVHVDSLTTHLRRNHGILKVTKNTQVLTTTPSNIVGVSSESLKSGSNFVIKVGAQNESRTINGNVSDVAKPGGLKIITTSSGNLYKKISLQQSLNTNSKKIFIQKSRGDSPFVNMGTRIIMKSGVLPVSANSSASVSGTNRVLSLPNSKPVISSTPIVRIPKIQVNGTSGQTSNAEVKKGQVLVQARNSVGRPQKSNENHIVTLSEGTVVTPIKDKKGVDNNSSIKKRSRKQILQPNEERNSSAPSTPTFPIGIKKRGRKPSREVGSPLDKTPTPRGPRHHRRRPTTEELDDASYTPGQNPKGMKAGMKKKRGPGRPRKERVESPEPPELDTLFNEDGNEDTENEPVVPKQEEKEEEVPTVELDLFTLPSLNEQVSVLLTEPENPNFKVYANMDAIFVGDSALGDVTNQIGYVTDANNVVFVNPGHFLFPNVGDLENFVPTPIVTTKGPKVVVSPNKQTSRVNTSKTALKDTILSNVIEQSSEESQTKQNVGQESTYPNTKQINNASGKESEPTSPLSNKILKTKTDLHSTGDLMVATSALETSCDSEKELNNVAISKSSDCTLGSKSTVSRENQTFVCDVKQAEQETSPLTCKSAMDIPDSTCKDNPEGWADEEESTVPDSTCKNNPEGSADEEESTVADDLPCTPSPVKEKPNYTSETAKRLLTSLGLSPKKSPPKPETAAGTNDVITSSEQLKEEMASPKNKSQLKNDPVKTPRTRRKSAMDNINSKHKDNHSVECDNVNNTGTTTFMAKRKRLRTRSADVLMERENTNACLDSSKINSTSLKRSPVLARITECDNKSYIKATEDFPRRLRSNSTKEGDASPLATGEIIKSSPTPSRPKPTELLNGKEHGEDPPTPVKRGRGRPKKRKLSGENNVDIEGKSPNKEYFESNKAESNEEETNENTNQVHRRLRSPSSHGTEICQDLKLTKKESMSEQPIEIQNDKIKRRPGRPGKHKTSLKIKRSATDLMNKKIIGNLKDFKFDKELISIPKKLTKKTSEKYTSKINKISTKQEPIQTDTKESIVKETEQESGSLQCSRKSEAQGDKSTVGGRRPLKKLGYKKRKKMSQKMLLHVQRLVEIRKAIANKRKIDAQKDTTNNASIRSSYSEDHVLSVTEASEDTNKISVNDPVEVSSNTIESPKNTDIKTNAENVSLLNSKSESLENTSNRKSIKEANIVGMPVCDAVNEVPPVVNKGKYKLCIKKLAMQKNVGPSEEEAEDDKNVRRVGQSKRRSIFVKKTSCTKEMDGLSQTEDTKDEKFVGNTADTVTRHLRERRPSSKFVESVANETGKKCTSPKSPKKHLKIDDLKPLSIKTDELGQEGNIVSDVSLKSLVKLEKKDRNGISPGKNNLLIQSPLSPSQNVNISPRSADLSPSREWHGRGAKLKAQVLIQDQQAGVIDSQVVPDSPDSTTKCLTSPLRIITDVHTKHNSPMVSPKSHSPTKSPGTPRLHRSPRSPSQDDREWQARRAKLKAQVIISDQQSGVSDSIVDSGVTENDSDTKTVAAHETLKSAELTSPTVKKVKLDTSPGMSRDIRSFFASQVSPQNKRPKSDASATPITSGFTSPTSRTKKKTNRYSQKMDIRSFFSPDANKVASSVAVNENMSEAPENVSTTEQCADQVYCKAPASSGDENSFEGFENVAVSGVKIRSLLKVIELEAKRPVESKKYDEGKFPAERMHEDNEGAFKVSKKSDK